MNKRKMIHSGAIKIILSFCFLSCQTKEAKQTAVSSPAPYQVFYNAMVLPETTDTVLVQSQTRVFGCGTGALAYQEELQSSGLDKFYEQYGDVLSDTAGVATFSRKNKTRILWVTRGIEGEAMALADSALHADSAFEKRMFAEKCFIKIAETPERLNKVKVYASVAYPASGTVFTTNYLLSLKDNTWIAENISSDTTRDQESFEEAYYP